MARTLRFFGKKRRHRRSGSKRLAHAWELALFGVLTLAGAIGMWAVLATLILPEYRANRQFVPTTCHILDKRIGRTEREGQILHRPEVFIEYRVGEQRYWRWTYDVHTLRGNGYTAGREDIAAVLSEYTVDPQRQVQCWYNPAKPEEVVLVRGYQWWVWLIFLVPLSLLLIGGGGLLYMWWTWGKSAERLAVEGPTPLAAAKKDQVERRRRQFPGVPAIRPPVETPGKRLACRLPAAATPTWSILAWLLAALFWNGTVLAAFLLDRIFGGAASGGWGPTLFWLLAVAVGVGLLMAFFRQLFLTAGLGRTALEISGYPLYPGEEYRVFVEQSGNLKMLRFEVLLICEEEATFEHGTNTRREKRRVYQATVLCHERFEILPSLPYEGECEIDIPADAMHSFKSDHNEVRWRILVRGKAEGWPAFERSFSLVVLPQRLPAAATPGRLHKGKVGRLYKAGAPATLRVSQVQP